LSGLGAGRGRESASYDFIPQMDKRMKYLVRTWLFVAAMMTEVASSAGAMGEKISNKVLTK